MVRYILKHKSRDNSKYYNFILGLRKEYMPSLSSPMTYEVFERLMSQAPHELEQAEVIWTDLLDKNNLVSA